MAPSRAALVVAVAWMFPCYGLADLWARAGMAFGRGPALSMQARHGGKATNATMDAPKRAGLLRGGLRPPATGEPAAMRATRALLRAPHASESGRRPWADRLAQVQHITRQ